MCAKALWDILNLGEKHNDVYHLWNIMRTTSLKQFTLINISLHCIPFGDAIYLCKVEYLIVAAIKSKYHEKINMEQEWGWSPTIPRLGKLWVANRHTYPISKYLWLLRNEIKIFFLSTYVYYFFKQFLSC